MRFGPRVLMCALSVVFGLFSPNLVSAQANFSTVVVFGDSLSDTGNIAHLTQSATAGLLRYPSDNPALGFDYTDGRFTDGKETQPAAQAYIGVWIEQLAAAFGSQASGEELAGRGDRLRVRRCDYSDEPNDAERGTGFDHDRQHGPAAGGLPGGRGE